MDDKIWQKSVRGNRLKKDSSSGKNIPVAVITFFTRHARVFIILYTY